jgi:hypothetical protein
LNPEDLDTADVTGFESGDLFLYSPDPSWQLHPYMWRIRDGEVRAADQVLRDDVVALEPNELLVILQVQGPGRSGDSRSATAVGGLTVFARGGVFWLHLDTRIDRSLSGHVRLVSRI